MSSIRTHNNRRRSKERKLGGHRAILWGWRWETPAMLPDWYVRMQHSYNPEQDFYA